jgi:hypothetical protein
MSNVDTLLADGLVQFGGGNADAALRLVEQALQLEPGSPRALAYLAYLQSAAPLKVVRLSDALAGGPGAAAGASSPGGASSPAAGSTTAAAAAAWAPAEDPHRKATVVMSAVANAAGRAPDMTATWFTEASVNTQSASMPVSLATPPPTPGLPAAPPTKDPWAGNSIPPRTPPPAGPSSPAAAAAKEGDTSWSGEVKIFEDANADGLNGIWSKTDASTSGRARVPGSAAPAAPVAAAAPADAVPAASPWDDGPNSGVSVDLDQAQGERQTRKPATSSRLPSVAVPTQPITVQDVASQCVQLMARVKEHHDLGDFSGSLELVEKVLELDPRSAEALDYLEKNAETLQKMYASKLGNLERVPRLTMTPEQVIWLNLHHKAGFVLSRVDGMATYEDILSVSAMPRLETMRILVQLADAGVIKPG